MPRTTFPIRPVREEDHAFILGLVPRFTEFPLPPWRQRDECTRGIDADIARHLREPPEDSFLFVATEADGGQPVGFIHLQRTQDFFTGSTNAYISDLAVGYGHEGRGVARALLAHAETWAREQHCQLLTLSVFPGNERARKLYAASGYEPDMLRLAKPLR